MLPSNPPNAPKLPNRPLELPNYGLWQAKSCLFYRPETAGCSLQTLQTLRNFQTGPWSCQTMGCGRPSLAFSTGPKLQYTPFKPSKRSETSKPALGAATKPAKPALGAAKLWAVAGQVLPFLPARNCRMLPSNPPKAPKLPHRLLELPRNLPNRLLELPNYGPWQAKSFLCYRPDNGGCSLQTLQTLRNFQNGSWSCHETCQTSSWSCHTMGCGRPSLSFSTSPETAGCSLQTIQTLRNFHTGSWSCHETCKTVSWSCQTMGCGRPSLSFSTGPGLPDATSGAFAGSAKGATASPHSLSDIDQPPPLLRRKPHCSTRLGSLSGPD